MRKTIPPITFKQLHNFWKKVSIKSQNECWPWLAHCDRHGYGVFSLYHTDYLAPRIMLAITGKRNDNLDVRHSCNNPACINPKHLRFGTPLENQHDRILAGTHNIGSRNGHAKLTELDIPIIRNLAEIMTQTTIGKLFNVSHSTINYIVKNKNWTHVVGTATDIEVENYLNGR